MEFHERFPLEKGFARVFRERVWPALERIEAERVERLEKTRKMVRVVVAGAVALALFVMWRGDFGATSFALSMFIALIAFILAGVIQSAQKSRWTEAVAQAVMPAVCEHVGDLSYQRRPEESLPLDRMQALGLFGRYSRATVEDLLKGRWRDTGFRIAQAHLSAKTQDGQKTNKTAFDGLLFEIEVPTKAPAPILIARDYGGFGNKLNEMFAGRSGRGMPRVDTGHAAFEAAFEVYSTDPEAAREFLPPAFLDNLLAIGETEGGRRGAGAMTAGFDGDRFFMALAREGDFLKMGSLDRSVHDMEDDLHAIFDDIAMVRRIIDRLHGDAPDASPG